MRFSVYDARLATAIDADDLGAVSAGSQTVAQPFLIVEGRVFPCLQVKKTGAR